MPSTIANIGSATATTKMTTAENYFPLYMAANYHILASHNICRKKRGALCPYRLGSGFIHVTGCYTCVYDFHSNSMTRLFTMIALMSHDLFSYECMVQRDPLWIGRPEGWRGKKARRKDADDKVTIKLQKHFFSSSVFSNFMTKAQPCRYGSNWIVPVHETILLTSCSGINLVVLS